jgi:hypothetical protein
MTNAIIEGVSATVSEPQVSSHTDVKPDVMGFYDAPTGSIQYIVTDILALSEQVPWRGRLSKRCWRWQREQVSTRGSASVRAKPICEHAEQRTATKAM